MVSRLQTDVRMMSMSFYIATLRFCEVVPHPAPFFSASMRAILMLHLFKSFGSISDPISVAFVHYIVTDSDLNLYTRILPSRHACTYRLNAPAASISPITMTVHSPKSTSKRNPAQQAYNRASDPYKQLCFRPCCPPSHSASSVQG